MYTPKPRLSNLERLFLVLVFPFIVLLAVNPLLMLLLAVSVMPLGLAVHLGVRLFRDVYRGKEPAPVVARRFRVGPRPAPLPTIRHHWTVSTSEPRRPNDA